MATIKGKWVFNETLVAPSTYILKQTVSFISGELQCDGIYAHYYESAIEEDIMMYSVEGINSGVYSYDNNHWYNTTYKTVDFGTTEQTVSDAFLAWMQANATQVIEITSTTITYNGTELASLEEGQTATLSCEGTKAKTDVSIFFGSKGSITYKGVTTEIEAGKTATLLCSGKKFATDVVVTVESGVSLINFTIDGNTYEAEVGMTWYEWTNSSYPYSPDGYNNFTCASTDSLVMFGGLTVTEYGNGVFGNDLIDSSVQYSTEFL